MKTPFLPATALQIARDPGTGFLSARWQGPVPEVLLMRHYVVLLAEAHRLPGGHFWLLDLRGRNWPSPRFEHWFSHILAPRVTDALGHPVFVACVLDAGHATEANGPAAAASQRECATHDLYTYFFDGEDEARNWLRHQQEHYHYPVLPG